MGASGRGPGESEVKVYDRRRFDRDGNPRVEREPEPPSPAPEQAGVAAHAAGAPPARGLAEEQVHAEVFSELSAVRAELEASRKRVDELARAYQALDRDREDFKARLSRERERMLDIERGNVALALLEAVDELDLCLTASGDQHSPLAKGVRLIRDNILRRLESVGIERLEVVGQPFDPNLAEAADMELTANPEDDQKVIAEVRAGYRLKDRVIRHATVKVAQYVKPAEA
ncbi:MAG: nucleotide exchange factor GrpE [Myxococcales bacterium]|nr:nucleotide exchange factor GrpE [Myxococcales bacterium]